MLKKLQKCKGFNLQSFKCLEMRNGPSKLFGIVVRGTSINV